MVSTKYKVRRVIEHESNQVTCWFYKSFRMSEKKYADSLINAVNQIKQELCHFNIECKGENNYLNQPLLLEILKPEQFILNDIDQALAKINKSKFLLDMLRRLMEAERRRRKYEVLINQEKEQSDIKHQLKQMMRKRRSELGSLMITSEGKFVIFTLYSYLIHTNFYLFS